MQVKLYNIFGKIKIEGEYKSLTDCMVKNKYKLGFVDFQGIDCNGTDFSGANFREADCSYADFRGAKCKEADCIYTNFRGANCSRADFREANCRDAVCCDADFRGANCNGADFRGADCRGTDFREAEFCLANCRGADFREAKIEISQLYLADCVNAMLDHPLIKIHGSRDLFCYYNGWVKIGCERHTIEEWLNHGPFTNEYNKEQQKEYMGYIRMIGKME